MNTRKTVSAALAVAVITASGLFAVPASAAAMIRNTPVETSAHKATEVNYYGGYYYYYPRHRHHYYYNNYYYNYNYNYGY